MLKMVVQLYDTLGLDNSVNDHLLEQYKRTMAVSWACSLRHKQCLDNVLSLYRQWMTNPDNNTIIAPSLKSAVYCQALATGGAEEWDFAWNQYLKSNVASEKHRLLRAMGCTKQLWLLSRYLEMAFDPNSGIRRQDSELVFGSIAFNDIGRPLAWTFLRDNWKMIYEYFEGKARPYLITSSTSNFNTRQQLKEVMTFVDEHRTELKSASRKVEQKIEIIKNNIAWMDANYETIYQWLEQKGYSVKLRNV
ncbi:aminopeptidase N-like [Cherax quadricarinatus]